MTEHLRFVSPRDRVLFLRPLPAFEGVSTSDLMPVAQISEEVYFRKGDVIFEIGDPIDHAYMLVEGAVTLERDGEQIAVIEAPAPLAFTGIFGALEGMLGTVTASRDVLALAISRDRLMHLWENQFSLVLYSIQLAALRIWEERKFWPYDRGREPEVIMGEEPEGPMTFIDFLEWERSFSPFEGMNLESLAEICRHQREVRYEAGEILWREGDPSTSFVRIVHGIVEIEQEAGRTGELGYDWTLGFIECVGGTERGYTARAKTDLRGVRSDIDTFLAILDEQFELANRILRTLSWSVAQQIWKTGEHALLTR